MNINRHHHLPTLSTQQSYTDLHSLQTLRHQGGDNKEAALKQVAQQFESLFIQMMLKSMRSANSVFGQDNPLNSFAMRHHQDMYDKQLGLSLSTEQTHGNGMGLAEALYRQMSNHYLSEPQHSAITPVDKTIPPPTKRIPDNPVAVPQRITDAGILNRIDSPQDFIRAVSTHAKPVARALGVDYRVLVAQSALETGWGQHIIRDPHGQQSFNLFNIKTGSHWQGDSVTVPTLEYVDGIARREIATFRRYASIEDSFADYRQFLQQPRYQKALAVSANAEQFVKELHHAGYATDPHYAEKIQTILNNPTYW